MSVPRTLLERYYYSTISVIPSTFGFRVVQLYGEIYSANTNDYASSGLMFIFVRVDSIKTANHEQ